MKQHLQDIFSYHSKRFSVVINGTAYGKIDVSVDGTLVDQVDCDPHNMHEAKYLVQEIVAQLYLDY